MCLVGGIKCAATHGCYHAGAAVGSARRSARWRLPPGGLRPADSARLAVRRRQWWGSQPTAAAWCASQGLTTLPQVSGSAAVAAEGLAQRVRPDVRPRPRGTPPGGPPARRSARRSVGQWRAARLGRPVSAHWCPSSWPQLSQPAAACLQGACIAGRRPGCPRRPTAAFRGLATLHNGKCAGALCLCYCLA